jgi:hypothetical protein
LIFLHVKTHFSTTTERGVNFITGDGERTTSSRLPDVLFIIVVLGNNLDLVSNEVSRVETNTELTNHGNISTRRESFHESLSTRLGNSTQVVNQISLGHTNTSITDRQDVVFLIRSDTDVEILLGIENRWISQRLITNLIQSIRRIGNQFTQENFLQKKMIC